MTFGWGSLRNGMTHAHPRMWLNGDCWAWKGWEVVCLRFWPSLSFQPCKTGLWWNDWLFSLLTCLPNLFTGLSSLVLPVPFPYHPNVVGTDWLCLPGALSPLSMIVAPHFLQGTSSSCHTPGHCDWPSNEHMTQAKPIRILPGDFTVKLARENHFFPFGSSALRPQS